MIHSTIISRSGARIVSLWLIIGTMLTSCAVTEPDESPWQDVASFSWPTAQGTLMKYRTEHVDDGTEEFDEITIDRVGESYQNGYHNGERMFMLSNPQDPLYARVLFLPSHDTLIVRQEVFGGEIALAAPLEKGHTWISATDPVTGEATWEASIIERFAYRKVEGKIYEDVVAVKYRRIKQLGGIYENEEWIRFWARGVGEILTIRNVYPDSNYSSETVPQQKERKILIETTAAS